MLNKLCILSISFVLLFSHPILAQEQKNNLTWYTDINEAYEVSAKTKKPIFAFFTGSDWCIWCKRLQKNVFEKPGFQAWANNVVLLELDFPRTKQLPQKLAEQNNGLQQAFQVQGFPTVWLFHLTKDATNKYSISALGNLGYPQSEAGKEESTFIDTANELLKKDKPKS